MDGLRKRPAAVTSRFLTDDELSDKTQLLSSKDGEDKVHALINVSSDVGRHVHSNLTLWFVIAWSTKNATWKKFAGHYIKRTFYFDVHPPLGKMLNGFAGLVAGFNGTFNFESGAEYPPELSYGVMRFFNAIFGALMAPLAYYTGIHLHMSHPGAILVASMVVFALSVCCLVVFHNYQKTAPFSTEWFLWMFFTGISLGSVLSVKWVGLFSIALVGLHTVDELWDMLGNLKMSLKTYGSHWIVRAVCLICVPASIYLASFVMHFSILNHSGPGDAQMSSLFQAGLVGNDFSSNPLELAFGSKVSIKNNARGGGLLHSHVQRYPSGSTQQQVTCYHHKDSNNEFLIMKPWGDTTDLMTEPIFVEDGDKIRLVHISTFKNIHSHYVDAPITTTDYEVSGYGNATFGDQNDLTGLLGKNIKRIRSLTTRFRLRHVTSGCLLRADGVTLPQWGFKQIEVVCQKKPKDDEVANYWNIELHVNSNLPPGGKNAYKSSFFRDFIDLNVAMWSSNNALTPDADKEPDQLVSQPYHWPLMTRGLRMCGWSDSDIKYYLLGNPIVWWGSTVSLLGLIGLTLIYVIRWRRGCRDFSSLDEWDNFYMAAKVGVLGWFLHYFPFYIMGRVMYVHHYFPSLYFAIIAFAFLVDHLSGKFSKLFHFAIVTLIGLIVFRVFLFFADLTFGMSGSPNAYANRKWLKTWNINDSE
ncbi:dolichyl-phosphate-mannose-protein mannosyltransferase [Batrachochytrium dendrobatidis JEL423]|uniref:Dolichyl-phosphate-mannose--protein mannosyltransferase n=1 Tax=Batrachochytrium dendrobatidis (strain JEL423) TaxID=403673 RepID=A0A177WYQ8_BATDL|nr:dolichyl-phosphate-mannose-protein mannosyltransferase [Batrachochytrium dendrobatidis JEL423]